MDTSGIKLWGEACKVIPGGNGLLSKRPDRYLPNHWPTYYSKAKGVEIWDMDGNKYVDMCQMGIGTAILGYCNDNVDSAVIKGIKDGVNTTLNCPEEVELAKKLIELNPFAGGVRYARTGGEAMAIAIRIARAFSGRDNVAFSGYHGWSDWYLATNLNNTSNLEGHLLPGLHPKGVPTQLAGTVFPYQYNDAAELEGIVKDKNIGVIVLEGARYDFPSVDFINEIQRVSEKYKCVIIVDEITSGWRMTDGGVYKLNELIPDIVVYGKGMGNGYAISAVVGKKEVMDVVQDTFISSTFWTEKVGFVAALATIKELTRNKVWEHLHKIGDKIGNGWLELSKKHDINLQITDFKPLITFKLDHGELNPALLTLFTQEMLSYGYLASCSVYVSYAHSESIIDDYLLRVDHVFSLLTKAIKSNTVMKLLRNKVREDGFKRVT